MKSRIVLLFTVADIHRNTCINGGKMSSFLFVVFKAIDSHHRRCEMDLCPSLWSQGVCACVFVCVSVGVLAGGMCIVYVWLYKHTREFQWLFFLWNRSLKRDYEQLYQWLELSYAHTKYKPILLRIFSDLCFLCHVKTVTGVSPKAKNTDHCLPIDLTVFIVPALWDNTRTL